MSAVSAEPMTHVIFAPCSSTAMKEASGAMRGRARGISHILLVVVFAVVAAATPAPPSVPPPPQISADAVLADLNQTIDWYHRVEAIDASGANSQELLLRSNVRENAREVVRLGLQFARAQAVLLETSAAATAGTRPATAASGGRGGHKSQNAAPAPRRAAEFPDQGRRGDRPPP